jgi:hypothetical protein
MQQWPDPTDPNAPREQPIQSPPAEGDVPTTPAEPEHPEPTDPNPDHADEA